MAIAVVVRKLDLVGKSVRSLTVRYYTVPYGAYDADFTLPRKTSKENGREPYLKPTQVDEGIMPKGARENARSGTRQIRPVTSGEGSPR